MCNGPREGLDPIRFWTMPCAFQAWRLAEGSGRKMQGHHTCPNVCRKVADSAVEGGEQGQDKSLCRGVQRLSPFVAFIRCHDRHENPRMSLRRPCRPPIVFFAPRLRPRLSAQGPCGGLFVTREAYCFASLLSHQLTKNTLEFHFITNASFEGQLLSISAFPDVWQACVDRFNNLIGPLNPFFVDMNGSRYPN